MSRHVVSAGAYFATALGMVGLAVTFFLAAHADWGRYFVGFGWVCAILTVICLWAALHAFAAVRGGAPDSVPYPQFMKLREENSRLVARVSELETEVVAARPRRIAPLRVVAAAVALKPIVDQQREVPWVTVYPYPTVADSAVLAGSIRELLTISGVVLAEDDPPSLAEYPLQAHGIWVVGKIRLVRWNVRSPTRSVS